MTWSEQAESLMKVWTDAQKGFFENWYKALQTGNMPTVSPFTGITPAMVENWRKLAMQGMEMWMAGSQPAAKEVASQMVASQAAMMRLLEMTANAWRAMAPRLDSGEDWQKVLSSYMDQVRQQMTPVSNQEFAQMSQNVDQLWRLYIEQFQQLAKPFVDPLRQTPGAVGEALAEGRPSDLTKLTSVYWNAYRDTFGRIINAPGFGFTRELQEKMSDGFAAWTKMREATNNYQLVVADSWNRIFERVLREMIKRAEQGKPVKEVRELMRLWTTAADEGLLEVFRSQAYIDAQVAMVNTTMTYRLHEQQIVETFLQQTYIPTRSEVDEAHQNVYNLRKEVKALRKSVKELQAIVQSYGSTVSQPAQSAQPVAAPEQSA